MSVDGVGYRSAQPYLEESRNPRFRFSGEVSSPENAEVLSAADGKR